MLGSWVPYISVSGWKMAFGHVITITLVSFSRMSQKKLWNCFLNFESKLSRTRHARTFICMQCTNVYQNLELYWNAAAWQELLSVWKVLSEFYFDKMTSQWLWYIRSAFIDFSFIHSRGYRYMPKDYEVPLYLLRWVTYLSKPHKYW